MEEKKERAGIPFPDLRPPPSFQPWLHLCRQSRDLEHTVKSFTPVNSDIK